MAIQSLFPAIRPSLNLDFANTKVLDPRITFSRASTATFYDGKTVAKAEENLLTYSQEFDNAAWTYNAATVVANSTTAPDGTSTADTITETTATDGHYVLQNNKPFSTALFSLSVYVKSNGRNFFVIGENSTGSARRTWFNIGTGAVATTNAGHTATISNVGSGWYRCTITFTGTSTSSWVAFYPSSADAMFSYTGDGTSGLYIWGAQLEQRSSVTAYTPTTTQPITNYIPALQTAAANVARFDHDPVTGESKGLLIEEQRTNLLTYSDQFDNAVWAKTNATITANTVVAPDGTLTADKQVEDTTNGLHRTYQTYTFVNSTAYSISVYIKAGGRVKFAIMSSDGVTSRGTGFNLSNGTTFSIGYLGITDPTTSSITSIGNGWYRCSISFTAGGTSGNIQYRLLDGSGNDTYTGDGYSGIYIWGAQLEAGSFPTSYIPTTTSQVTRSADSASMTGSNFSSWYRQEEGTLFVDVGNTVGLSGLVQGVVTIGYTGTNILGIERRQSQYRHTVFGSDGANLVMASPTGQDKQAFAYKGNDAAGSQNGSAVVTDSSVTLIQGADRIRIGGSIVETGSIVPLGMATIKRIAYYPKRLSNTELQALTS